MKLKDNPSAAKQNGIAAAEFNTDEGIEGGSSLSPPLFSPTSNVIQRQVDDAENSSFDDWSKQSYAYGPGASHINTIRTWSEKSDVEVYLEVNKIESTALLHKLREAIAKIENPSTRLQKKLKSYQLLINGRINTLTSLEEQDASAEKIEGMSEKDISNSWNSVPKTNINYKHIEGNGMLHNPKLTTKIREVREKSSTHNWGSTGYDMYIPYSIIPINGWTPIILNPVLYIDVDVGKKEDFKKIEDFKPYYEEYKGLVESNGGDKEAAFDQFSEKHTVDGVTTDLPLPQDATIYHEAGHVKEFQDSYDALMSNFLEQVKSSMKKKPDKQSANQEYSRLFKQMWMSFSSDENHKTHTHIVKNEIKAMIALYEGKSEEEAYAEHGAFNEIRDKVNKK